MKDEGRMKVSRSMTNCLHFFLLLFPLTFTLYPFTFKSNAAEFKEIQQRGYLLVAAIGYKECRYLIDRIRDWYIGYIGWRLKGYTL